jgi:hypothetical protein
MQLRPQQQQWRWRQLLDMQLQQWWDQLQTLGLIE